MPRPLGYFLSWGTYGTRLHGDPRGTVDRTHNQRGDPVLGFDAERWEFEKGRLRFPPVVLSRHQQLFAEELIPSICERGRWTYHTCACAPDHVHVILASPFDPGTIRRLIKRWLGQELSERWTLPQGATWWAEDGSIRWLCDERYFENAIDYVSRQRTTPAELETS
jgi:REP element-mobilizing transposase RayT